MNAEKYIKYLNKEMSPDEVKQFEALLRGNNKYLKELATMKEMRSFAKVQAEEQHALDAARSVYSEYLNKKVKNTNSSRFGILKYLIPISIAAMLIIGFFAMDLSSDMLQDNDQLYANYFNPVELSLVVRSEVQQNLEKEAEISFNNKDYQLANDKLTKLLVEKPNDKRLLLYKAITDIEIGDQITARSTLSNLSEDELFKSESHYFTGLSYLKTDNLLKAKESMERITVDSHRYSEAQEIIEHLSK